MNKDLLIKYLKGEADSREREMVAEWLNKSSDNLRYYSSLKSIYVLSGLPNKKASSEEMKNIDTIIGHASKIEKEERKNGIISKYLKLTSVAAVALLAISITLSIFFIKEIRINKKLIVDHYWESLEVDTTSTGKSYIHELYTEAGVKGMVTLPDGSRVWLNSSSKIIYPHSFSGDVRCVSISGEAFFDVIKDSLKPMIVSTNRNFKIRVTGTKFNVRSYEDDNEAQTTLISGSITLFQKGDKGVEKTIAKLSPQQSYVISDHKPSVHIKHVDTVKQSAWRDGVLIFDQTPMTEVIKILHRWHGADFIVEDSELLKFRFTANFKSESIVQIMEMIKFCSNIDYKIEDRKVTLFEKYKK